MSKNERCVHDFLPGQCYVCGREIPFGIYETVYKTKNGSVFHNLRDCAYLYSGQNFAASKGGQDSPINPTPWHSVFNSLGACEWCCAAHNLGEKNLTNCTVSIQGEWVQAKWVRKRFVESGVYEHLVYFLDTKKILVVPSNKIRFLK